MTPSFISDVFGGKSPRALAVAVTRTFAQGWVGTVVAAPLVLDVSLPLWKSAAVGGITAVIALVHGLLQSPGTEATTVTTTTTSAPTEVTVSTEGEA